MHELRNEAVRDKTCLLAFGAGITQTSLRRDIGNTCIIHYNISEAKNKGTDQAAQKRRLSCGFLVRIYANRTKFCPNIAAQMWCHRWFSLAIQLWFAPENNYRQVSAIITL